MSVSWKSLKKSADDASRPLPPDWYPMEVAKAEATTASTGAPMIKAQLRVIEGPFSNRILFTNFVLSLDNPNALIIFFRTMAAFGFDDTFFDTLPDDNPAIGLQIIADTLIGRRVSGEVGTKIFQGTERNEVTGYRQASNIPGTSGIASSPSISTPGSQSSLRGSGAAGGVPPVPSVPSTPPTPSTPPASSPPTPSPTVTGGNGTPPPSVPAF